MGHTKPNAAHCFCAVAFQGGVAASAFLNRRFCIGVSQPACLHRAFLHQLSAASRWCSIVFHAGSPAERQLFRTDFRFAPSPRRASLAVPLPVAALSGRPMPQSVPDGPPVSNKPHPAEKSTPVWLAIWHTWAGFANSQLRCAAFCCTYSYICTIPVTAALSSCSDIANLSAHLHRLPTPRPDLRQMRLSPSRGRRYPISDKAAAWPGHRGLVLYMAATWPGMEFEQITEHGCES